MLVRALTIPAHTNLARSSRVLVRDLTLPRAPDAQVAFVSETNIGLLFFINQLVNTLFFFDVIITFVLIVDENGTLIKSHSEIAKRYLRSWFAVDIISIFPFDLLYLAGAFGTAVDPSALRAIRIVRLARLVKLLRMYAHIFPYLPIPRLTRPSTYCVPTPRLQLNTCPMLAVLTDRASVLSCGTACAARALCRGGRTRSVSHRRRARPFFGSL